MLKPVYTARYKKNFQLLKKRGYNMSKLDEVIDEYLIKQIPLPLDKNDHKLSGNWEGYRECHIEPDWLLIYRVDKEKVLLYMMRTGTHSDLFR